MDYGNSMKDTFTDNFLEWTGFTTNVNTRKFNSAEAQKQRDWSKEMDDTKYQRAVNDMQAAGLNPAMMFGGSGAGASSPSGASAGSSSGSAGGMGGLASTINAAANLSNSFNQDKDKSNNISFSDTMKLINTVAKFI